jgi:head-tail adaptor
MVAPLLNRRVSVWRQTSTPDAGGGRTSTWAKVATTPARFSAPNAKERQVAVQSGVEVTHNVYLPADATVVRGDRLVDGATSVEVVTLIRPSDPLYTKAECREEPWRPSTSP